MPSLSLSLSFGSVIYPLAILTSSPSKIPSWSLSELSGFVPSWISSPSLNPSLSVSVIFGFVPVCNSNPSSRPSPSVSATFGFVSPTSTTPSLLLSSTPSSIPSPSVSRLLGCNSDKSGLSNCSPYLLLCLIIYSINQSAFLSVYNMFILIIFIGWGIGLDNINKNKTYHNIHRQ